MTDRALEQFFADLAGLAGTPPLLTLEATEVLDLARVVAHGFERRYAPLTAYVAGLAIGASAVADDPIGRAARARALMETVQHLQERSEESG